MLGDSGKTRCILFGDTLGVPQLCRHLPADCISAIVAAAIRPQYLEPLETFAINNGLMFIVQPRKDSLHYPEFLERIQEIGPDYIFVNSYSMKLYPEMLAVASKAAINIHGALLPQYRGCNPIQWGLLNDENEMGVTMHLMTEDIDAGDILAQRKVTVLHEDTWLDVRDKISDVTDEMLSEELPRIFQGQFVGMPQDEKAAQYYRRRTPEDGLIDWRKSAREIYNLIRALVSPLPGAFYYKRSGEKVVIDRYLTLNEVERQKDEIMRDMHE